MDSMRETTGHLKLPIAANLYVDPQDDETLIYVAEWPNV